MTEEFALTLGSVYALKAEDGFTLIRFPSMVISILSNSVLTGRLRSKAGEVVRGEVLKKAVETVKRKDSIQYVVTEELVEAYIVVISYLRWTEKCVSPRE